MEQDEFELAMRQLRGEYVRNLPSHVEEIECAWRTAQAAEWDAAQFRILIRLAHNLAGSGSTYGIESVSDAARALELYAKSLDGNVMPNAPARGRIELLLAQLRASTE
jgi:HPt (histidine-containing phosphotransfer) domain-containing protein